MSNFDDFTKLSTSISTARLLLQEAHKNGSLIEGICLYIIVIDGFLRLALIYSRTQKSPDHTHEVERIMIRQEDGDPFYMEKKIYQMALEEEVISQKTHDGLVDAYNFRNKIVHRFNTSDVSYSDASRVCEKLEVLYDEIYDIVAVLEHGENGVPLPTKEELDTFRKHAAIKIFGNGNVDPRASESSDKRS